ncbi:dipeptidase [Gemmatimonas sp.]|uniref:dipeptidase n=1 Tax=Gemmatimonas sp. TaxID=1962908 RepID=UPI003566285C
MKRVLVALLALMVVAVTGFLTVGARITDSRMNTVVSTALPAVSPVAAALHRRLFVADMHADQLLWGRDPLERVSRGHVDVPRLQEGGVALQVFSVVTKTPRGMNYDHNTGDTDNVLLLAIAEHWPRATYTSLRARAVYQADKLRDAALRSANTLTLITTREEMAQFVERRAGDPAQVSALLAIEGLHALDGKLQSVDTLYAAGFRMMGLTHFFDNEVAASAHGVTHAGLTPLGREVIARMESLGIIVDLAHASAQTVQEVLAMATRPVVVSHTGVAATCPGPRNLTDDQLRAIAANGGLVGIGYWDGAVCKPTVNSIVKAIVYAVKVAGAAHVALGSDFDGATRTPFDTRGMAAITDGLLKAGMEQDTIAAVMGGNTRDFLLQQLPSSSSTPRASR